MFYCEKLAFWRRILLRRSSLPMWITSEIYKKVLQIFLFCAIIYAKKSNKVVIFVTDRLKAELDVIVKTIADTGMASKIILFGSAARGDDHQDSDIDLCILTPITDRKPREINIELRHKLWDVQKVPLDLVTYNQDRFTEHAARTTSFAHVINTEGVVVYER